MKNTRRNTKNVCDPVHLREEGILNLSYSRNEAKVRDVKLFLNFTEEIR